MENERFPLREKKFAKTKIALANAFIERLQACRLDEIAIGDVCAGIDISAGTFFNYFPRKIDVVYYYNQLLSIKVLWRAMRQAAGRPVLAQIDAVFAVVREEYANPTIVYEMIAAMVGHKQSPALLEITSAEKYYAFPECAGIEDVPHPALMFEDFFEQCLEQARELRELPKTTDIAEALLGLKTILVGLPLAVRFEHFSEIGTHYTRQLNLLWRALGRKGFSK
ncbi:MAG: hypothetical protein NC924_01700 [Candidatus Omnitrophica bacterium]|nr:hypothetical protein [Candidatus Omnitrophota bacterium]